METQRLVPTSKIVHPPDADVNCICVEPCAKVVASAQAFIERLN